MKNKIYTILLASILAMSMIFSGCGNSADTDITEENSEETLAEETDSVSANEVPVEESVEVAYVTLSYTVGIISVNDNEILACDAQGDSFSLTLAETLSDDEAALITEGAVLVVSESVEEGSNPARTEGETYALTVVSVEPVTDTAVAAPVSDAVFYAVNGFKVESVDAVVKYAKSSVNLRKGPGTDYDKAGALSFAEEVTVTGVADNGWYQIAYFDGFAYVSNSYLVDEKPESSGNTGSGVSGNVKTATSGDCTYITEVDGFKIPNRFRVGSVHLLRAINLGADFVYGDMQISQETFYSFTLEELKDPSSITDLAAHYYMTGEAKPNAGGNDNPPAENDKGGDIEPSYCYEIVDLINQLRADEGMDSLNWDDDMAATALERAGELVNDFSHNGMRNCTSEIITMDSRDGVSKWYNNFYNSPAHHAAMINSYDKRVAAAHCKVNGANYVVVIFDIEYENQ